MSSFFDPVRAAFFDTDVNGTGIPEGALPVTPTRMAELFDGQAQGARIVAGPDGAPVLDWPAVPTPAEVLEAWRAGTTVSAFQAKAALFNRGLLDDAEAVAVAAGGLTLLAWRSATEFARLSPAITTLAPAIGIATPEDLDDLFREAAVLTA